MTLDLLFVIGIYVTGLVLIAIELFLIPGLGIAGPAGVLVLLFGAGVAWVQLGAAWGVGSLSIAVVVTGLGLWLFPRTRAAQRFVLQTDPSVRDASSVNLREFIGKEGYALTPLRPSGTAEFGEVRLDVVTDGVYIAAHQRVRVVEVEGTRVVVDEVSEQAHQA